MCFEKEKPCWNQICIFIHILDFIFMITKVNTALKYLNFKIVYFFIKNNLSFIFSWINKINIQTDDIEITPNPHNNNVPVIAEQIPYPDVMLQSRNAGNVAACSTDLDYAPSQRQSDFPFLCGKENLDKGSWISFKENYMLAKLTCSRGNPKRWQNELMHLKD